MEEFEQKLASFAERVLGAGAPGNLHRLTGGANMESWSFDHGGQGYVLRRSPSAEFMEGRAYGHDVEAAIVRAAFAAGVKAPEVVGELGGRDGLGTGYLMRRIEAEVSPAKILGNPPPSLLADLAREMARIHAIDPATLPTLPEFSPAQVLADSKARFIAFGGDRPVFALAISWLEEHLPPPAPVVLLHADFRLGNIMADAKGLAAVLDWEMMHLGDRHRDLAYGCINSWRFGQIDRPAFGLGQYEELWAAYERESGVSVDPAPFRWWLIYATLWWGLCCLQMANIWRSGQDSGLERVVIGRRASETEVDLLMLLETEAPEAERDPITLPQPAAPRRLGEPSTTEMLEALSAWIETDIKSQTHGRERFMAAVALNALGMLTRDAVAPVNVHDKSLADALLSGTQNLATPGLLAALKTASLRKLAADQPKYSAYRKACEIWGE